MDKDSTEARLVPEGDKLFDFDFIDLTASSGSSSFFDQHQRSIPWLCCVDSETHSKIAINLCLHTQKGNKSNPINQDREQVEKDRGAAACIDRASKGEKVVGQKGKEDQTLLNSKEIKRVNMGS